MKLAIFIMISMAVSGFYRGQPVRSEIETVREDSTELRCPRGKKVRYLDGTPAAVSIQVLSGTLLPFTRAIGYHWCYGHHEVDTDIA